MKWFLYLISLVWIAFGAWMILYTGESRNVAKKLLKNLDRRILCVFPFIAGILFLFAAAWSRQAWFIRLLGILGIIKGGFIFWNPNNLYEKTIDWSLSAISDQTYRLFGIMTLILGTVILSWIL